MIINIVQQAIERSRNPCCRHWLFIEPCPVSVTKSRQSRDSSSNKIWLLFLRHWWVMMSRQSWNIHTASLFYRHSVWLLNCYNSLCSAKLATRARLCSCVKLLVFPRECDTSGESREGNGRKVGGWKGSVKDRKPKNCYYLASWSTLNTNKRLCVTITTLVQHKHSN